MPDYDRNFYFICSVSGRKNRLPADSSCYSRSKLEISGTDAAGCFDLRLLHDRRIQPSAALQMQNLVERQHRLPVKEKPGALFYRQKLFLAAAMRLLRFYRRSYSCAEPDSHGLSFPHLSCCKDRSSASDSRSWHSGLSGLSQAVLHFRTA